MKYINKRNKAGRRVSAGIVQSIPSMTPPNCIFSSGYCKNWELILADFFLRFFLILLIILKVNQWANPKETTGEFFGGPDSDLKFGFILVKKSHLKHQKQSFGKKMKIWDGKCALWENRLEANSKYYVPDLFFIATVVSNEHSTPLRKYCM